MAGKKTGPNPTDRAKDGTKRSVLTEAHGIPISVAVDGANRNDMKMVRETFENIQADRPEPTEKNPQGLCLDIANAAGKLTISLDPLPACAEPRTMRAGSQSIGKVLVGDVYQVSGQSNPASSMDSCNRFPGAIEDIKTATLPAVRIFQMPWGLFKETPQEDVPASCSWESLRPEKNSGFSAIAFYFACSLNQHLDVPIGIVRASPAGGMAEIKMPKDALLSYEGRPIKRALFRGR